MAHVTSPLNLEISGRLGNVCFYRLNGKTFLRTRRTNDPKKWNRITNGARRAAHAFAGSVKVGNHIYRRLKKMAPKGAFQPYAHNHIATLLRKEAYRPNFTTHNYRLKHAVKALLGQEFGHQGNASQYIQMRNFGPAHKPEYTRIKGLLDAANAIDPYDKMHLQCRITSLSIPFQEASCGEDTKDWQWVQTEGPASQINSLEKRETEWIDRDNLHSEGICLDHPFKSQDHKLPILTFYIIEWRSIDGAKTTTLASQTCIRCQSMRIPDESLREIDAQDLIKASASAYKHKEKAPVPMPQQTKPPIPHKRTQ